MCSKYKYLTIDRSCLLQLYACMYLCCIGLFILAMICSETSSHENNTTTISGVNTTDYLITTQLRIKQMEFLEQYAYWMSLGTLLRIGLNKWNVQEIVFKTP